MTTVAHGQYQGTGSVTQGRARTDVSNLYSCQGGRVAGLGTITATDNSSWIVPSNVAFRDAAFPFAADLHNSCTGKTYSTAAQALAALDGTDIITIDPDGDLITAFVFADNYFEMYINGVRTGKDNVPFTQFNSNIVRFRVRRPFTIAMLLVDWEENLGLGSEANAGSSYHPGDGGMVAVFTSSTGEIIAYTNSQWKAQTYYTSPIIDLACPSEIGTLRLSNACSTQDASDGSAFYGLHWARPANWMDTSYDDSQWPNAYTFPNDEVGVNNKPAYTNFTNIFDDPTDDAMFIWSSNLILDNEVIVRYTVEDATSVEDTKAFEGSFNVVPNPVSEHAEFCWGGRDRSGDVVETVVFNVLGELFLRHHSFVSTLDVRTLPSGRYSVELLMKDGTLVHSEFVKW